MRLRGIERKVLQRSKEAEEANSGKNWIGKRLHFVPKGRGNILGFPQALGWFELPAVEGSFQ